MGTGISSTHRAARHLSCAISCGFTPKNLSCITLLACRRTNFSKEWSSFHCAPRNIFELKWIKQRCARTSAAGRLKCLRAVEDDVDTVSLPKTWFIWIRSLGRIIASSSSIACHPAFGLTLFEFLGSASTYSCARRILTSWLTPTAAPAPHAAAIKPYCRGSTKNLRLEKPRIECEWRDRCNRYPSITRVTVINQHIAIGRGGDGYDD